MEAEHIDSLVALELDHSPGFCFVACSECKYLSNVLWTCIGIASLVKIALCVALNIKV